MARLSDEDKQELLRVAAGWSTAADASKPAAASGQPPRRLLTPREYIEFATFASRFNRSRKPVAFDGPHWKL